MNLYGDPKASKLSTMLGTLSLPPKILDLWRPRPGRIVILLGSLAYLAAVLHFFFAFIKTESTVLLIETFAVALAPLVVVVALRAPLVPPFCLYVLLLPFDSVSSVGGGATLTKLLGIVSAGAVVLHLMRHRNRGSAPAATYAWLILLVWMTLSMAWALDQRQSQLALQMYASLITLYALLSFVKVKERAFNAVLAATVVAGVISAGYDAYYFRNAQSTMGAMASHVSISIGESSIDPNALASALVLPFAITLYWLFNGRTWQLRSLMVPALAVLMVGFASSGSRGGLTELATLFAYLIVRSRHRLWYLLLMLGSALGATAVNPGIVERFAQAQADGGAGRADIWHVGLYAFRDHWFIGAGIGNFPQAYDREYLHVFGTYVTGWTRPAHNVPLSIATELGIIGLALFMWALYLQFKMLHQVKSNNRLHELRLALEGACLGMVVAGFSSPNFNAKYTWLVFTLMPLMRSFAESATEALPQIKARLRPARTLEPDAVPMQRLRWPQTH